MAAGNRRRGKPINSNHLKRQKMKKFSILLSLALAMGFTACDDIEDPSAPQSNPQETVMSADGLTVSQALPAELKLADYKQSEMIPVLNIVELKDQPENSEINVDMQISKTEDFKKYSTITTTVENKVAKVNYADWDNIHRELFGKSPAAQTTYVRFEVTLTHNSTVVRLGGADTYFAATSLAVTPIDLGIVIDNAYYVVDATFGDGWADAAIPFTHSDVDVYEDPVFTVITPLAVGSYQFMSAIGMTEAKAHAGDEYTFAYGPAESALSGNLVYGENARPFSISTAGDYKITINMMEGTFMVQSYTPILYAVGGFNGWAHNASINIYERNEGVHSGFVDMSAAGDAAFEFKFSTQTNWNGTNYGAGDEDGMLSTDPGAGNLKLEHGGIYFFNVNTTDLTWTSWEVASVGIIGDATPGGWSDDTDLAYEGNLVWSGTMALVGGKEYKFRFNDAWDFSLGGSLDDLDENNGDNLKCDADGTYDVTLKLTDNSKWTATVVKHGENGPRHRR